MAGASDPCLCWSCRSLDLQALPGASHLPARQAGPPARRTGSLCPSLSLSADLGSLVNSRAEKSQEECCPVAKPTPAIVKTHCSPSPNAPPFPATESILVALQRTPAPTASGATQDQGFVSLLGTVSGWVCHDPGPCGEVDLSLREGHLPLDRLSMGLISRGGGPAPSGSRTRFVLQRTGRQTRRCSPPGAINRGREC